MGEGRSETAVLMISSHTNTATRLALYLRSGGRCEFCGEKVGRKGWDAHHRVKQSLGGLEEMSNLVVVSRRCHNRIHNAENQAQMLRLGWLVRSWLNPAEVPVSMFDGDRLLDDSGSTRPVG